MKILIYVTWDICLEVSKFHPTCCPWNAYTYLGDCCDIHDKIAVNQVSWSILSKAGLGLDLWRHLFYDHCSAVLINQFCDRTKCNISCVYYRCIFQPKNVCMYVPEFEEFPGKVEVPQRWNQQLMDEKVRTSCGELLEELSHMNHKRGEHPWNGWPTWSGNGSGHCHSTDLIFVMGTTGRTRGKNLSCGEISNFYTSVIWRNLSTTTM